MSKKHTSAQPHKNTWNQYETLLPQAFNGSHSDYERILASAFHATYELGISDQSLHSHNRQREQKSGR